MRGYRAGTVDTGALQALGKVDPVPVVFDAAGEVVAAFRFASNAELFAKTLNDTADPLTRDAMLARGDPPMGYGYRQLHADPSQVYALRWGQSGRITGVYGPVLESCAHDGSDPALPPYDNPLGTVGRRQTVEWANSQRWEVVR